MSHSSEKPAKYNKDPDCEYLNAAYVLAGLAMMLNIRLSYSSAPYALIRFGLPENLFSVFVRRMASALELWCLPSMALGNIMDIGQKIIHKYTGGGENSLGQDKQTRAGRLAEAEDASGAKDLQRIVKFGLIICPSIFTQWLNFITYVILLYVYDAGGDQGRLTTFYWTIAISGVVFGINMTLVYAVDWRYIPVYIAGENSFPIVTSFIHYLATLMFGNRRKYNSDFLIVKIDIWVAIIISFVAAVVWTYAYLCELVDGGVEMMLHIHAEEFDPRNTHGDMATPTFMVIVGMGLVYAIYPAIAPGMIVPFYLIDKIEMVLLIATFFPPVIIAILRRYKEQLKPKRLSILQPACKWGNDAKEPFADKWLNTGESWTSDTDRDNAQDAWHWHVIGLILMILKISLAAIFIYSLHYRDSGLSRSIINQPKMSTALSITFYMCHEVLLAVGFPGIVGDNAGANYVLISQYIGALFMIFLAFYSEGYIIEYKSHDSAHWPTDGMTKWNAFCYWCKRASKITNHNLRSLFKICLFRGLLMFIIYKVI